MLEMTMEEFDDAADTHQGYCTTCDDLTGDCCEPDAHKYECPVCEKNTLYGMAEAVICGFIEVTGE